MIEGLRPMADRDVDAVIALIGAVFDEYPGCVVDLDGVDADLPVLPRHLRDLGGDGWVVEHDEQVVALVGWSPTNAMTGELKRLYVHASARRAGLGTALVEHVVSTIRGTGRDRVELWSDTRFVDAHRLYERHGFVRQPQSRDLHDPSNTTEWQFVREPP